MLLKHLQYLTALARERHFARAAAACQVTQPTLSAGIKQLEDQLGLLVVQRGQRFEGLTAEGERVLAWAQRITADAESLEQEASRLRRVLEGRLRIAAPMAALTFDLSVGAVDLNQLFQTGPGETVQAIDILRDHGAEFSGLF